MIAVAAALLAGRVAAGPVETVSITGSAVSFRLTAIPGDTKTIRPFQIGTCEVTWDEYALYADSGRDEKVDGVTRPTQPDVENPRNPFSDGTVQTGRFPARSIGWYGACGYCAWLSLSCREDATEPYRGSQKPATGGPPGGANGTDRPRIA